MGLRASIYRDCSMQNCSNGGISAYADRVTVVNVPGPHEPTEDAPGVILQRGPLGTVNAVPVDGGGPQMIGPMMGGCYIATSDSRFSEKVRSLGGSYGAIALHDRYESVELNRSMSL
jgi:hypothetical protein